MAIKPETIGLRLRQARKNKGLSQNELGALVGVSGTAIMRYEKGEREPKIEQLQKIAGALELPFAYLLGTTDDPSADSFTSAAIEWAIQENGQTGSGLAQNRDENDIDLEKIASRAEELSKKRKEQQKPRLSRAELDVAIADALNQHIEAVKKICIKPDIRPDAIPDRINAATEYLKHGQWFIDGNGGGKID